MKIAAVLFILSVCYIASTEQAMTPSRSWNEMERKAQQGMEEFKAKAKAFSEMAKAAQVDVPTDPQQLQECANKQCPTCELSLGIAVLKHHMWIQTNLTTVIP